MRIIQLRATIAVGIAVAATTLVHADDPLAPGTHQTLTVRVTPKRGDTDQTYTLQMRGRFQIDLTGVVPAGKGVAFETETRKGDVFKLKADGTRAKTIHDGEVEVTVRGQRKPRVSFFDFEQLGPNGPTGRNLEPGKYEYEATLDVRYGWDKDGDGRIDDDEFDKLITAGAKATFVVEDGECDRDGPCCDLTLSVDERTARAGDRIRLAGWLHHDGEESVYQSLVVRLETLDGLELLRGDSEPYDIQPGEELLAVETVELPLWLEPDTYRLVVTMDRMVQGELTRTVEIDVVE